MSSAAGMKKVDTPKVVSSAEWMTARKEFLAKEKELTRLRDELSRQRRELPWEKVEKPYVFEGPNGKEALADLFDGRGQLIVYHFMFAPGWAAGCSSCSFVSDHFDGMTVHLANRDTTLVVVSRAPIAEIDAFRKRMGWQFRWVSAFGTDFNYDYHVSFTPGEKAPVARSTTTTSGRSFVLMKVPEPASLLKTPPAPYTTPIRPLDAGSRP